jgi:predicted HNH restriction endonuclease
MCGRVWQELMKKPITPKSQIRSALRRIFLRSRERAEVLKQAGYCCAKCGAKQSRAKGREVYVECHHQPGVDWAGLLELVRERLLAGPMVVLCKDCHKEEHE